MHIYPYVYTFANTTHTGTVWIVLTLTIDRYLALCQPLKHRAIGKKRWKIDNKEEVCCSDA